MTHAASHSTQPGRTPPPGARLQPGRLTLRACGLGLVVVVALWGAVAATGLVPAELSLAIGIGIALAALASLAGTYLLATQATLDPSHPQVAQRYMMALTGNFLLHLFLVAGAMLIAHLRPAWVGDVGRTGTAALGLAYASAATVQLVATATVLSAVLRARTHTSVEPSPRGQECVR